MTSYRDRWKQLQNRPEPWSLTEALEAVLGLYTDDEDEDERLTAKEINNGSCTCFAEDVCRLVPEATAVWDYELLGHDGPHMQIGGLHCFVRYQDRFYDSECLHGVDDWLDLPIYLECSDAREAIAIYRDGQPLAPPHERWPQLPVAGPSIMENLLDG